MGMPSSVHADANWINAKKGSIPEGAFKGGQEHPPGKQTLYVCHAKFNGGVHPGKVRPAFGGCNIGWGGKEHAVGKYQVLKTNPKYRWVPAKGGHIPKRAVKGGYEKGGKPGLFICRAKFKNGTHPGKVRPAFGGCNIGWGGKEHTVQKYSVLVVSPKWKNAKGGSIPKGAFKGGNEHPPGKQTLYVCHAKHKGGWHPGKVRPAFRGCNIGWGGKEHTKGKYQVLLTNPKYRWVPAKGGHIPKGAVKGGYEKGGKPGLFICRAKFKNGTHPGKVRPAFGGCNIGWGGKEHTVQKYSVLVKKKK
jgi:hypothetical protein